MKDRLELLVFEHQKHEHTGNIEKIVTEQGVHLNIVPLWSPVFHAGSLPTIWPMNEDTDGLLFMGGSMGVNDSEKEFPSKTMELRTIQSAYGRIPIFGTCLGAQEIAKALGADVHPNMVEGRVTKEIGYYRLSLTEEGMEDALYKGLDSSPLVLQWHGEAFDLPRGTIRLASSPLCENQAFVLREERRLLAYGQLFHLEMTKDMMPDWVRENEDWIHKDFRANGKQLIEETGENESILEEENRIVFGNFIEEVRVQARTRGKDV